MARESLSQGSLAGELLVIVGGCKRWVKKAGNPAKLRTLSCQLEQKQDAAEDACTAAAAAAAPADPAGIDSRNSEGRQ